jgi:hypothetical protein
LQLVASRGAVGRDETVSSLITFHVIGGGRGRGEDEKRGFSKLVVVGDESRQSSYRSSFSLTSRTSRSLWLVITSARGKSPAFQRELP